MNGRTAESLDFGAFPIGVDKLPRSDQVKFQRVEHRGGNHLTLTPRALPDNAVSRGGSSGFLMPAG